MPKVSVIIPCYNQGKYIDEAVDSVLSQTFLDYEIIIVNDGSTDALTNSILKNYNKPKTKVIHTLNNGVSAARNIAIDNSQGEYILPLDADDKIAKDFIELAVNIIESRPDIKIVYSEVKFFGEQKGKWKLAEFDMKRCW
jgi:glycosyltransferase involved in cell wall biosynthesis